MFAQTFFDIIYENCLGPHVGLKCENCDVESKFDIKISPFLVDFSRFLIMNVRWAISIYTNIKQT